MFYLLVFLVVYIVVFLILWYVLVEEYRWEGSPAFVLSLFWLPYMLYKTPAWTVQFVKWFAKGVDMLRKGNPQGRYYN